MGLKSKFGRWFGHNNNEKVHEPAASPEEVLEETSQDELLAEDVSDAEQNDEESAVENTMEEAGDVSNDLSEEISEEASDDAHEGALCEDASDDAHEGALCEEASDDAHEDALCEDANDAETTVVEEPAPSQDKKGFFKKLLGGLEKTRKSLNDKIDSVLSLFTSVDEDLFEELEEALILADVGVETSTYIINRLRQSVKESRIKEPSEVKGEIENIISQILSENDTTLHLDTNPSVIMVIGVNGVGKTTSIGKLAAKYKAEGKKVVLGAADTFRAAAIDQLQIWADRSGVDIIKHQEGSDPAAVVFDTIAAAKARGADVIILDTAGRLHNKKNLMDELSKIYRVMERELPNCSRETLLVLDATTGQNAVSQVKTFRESAAISGIILTKLDGSARGGIVLAIAHEENIPVKLVGVGEGIDDLQVFDCDGFAKALFSE